VTHPERIEIKALIV